jgi:hypothetical protein
LSAKDRNARKVRSKSSPPDASRSPKKSADIKVGEDLDLGKSEPCWNFGLVDHSHTGSWDWVLTDAERDTFLKFLKDTQSSTWNDLRAQDTGGRVRHKKHHSMATDILCKEAKDRLGEIGLGDQEELFRFRLSGKVRLWGAFLGDRHEFHILWWDRNHLVYPTD